MFKAMVCALMLAATTLMTSCLIWQDGTHPCDVCSR